MTFYHHFEFYIKAKITKELSNVSSIIFWTTGLYEENIILAILLL